MTKCCHGYCRYRCIENQTTAVHEPELQLKSKKRPIEKRHNYTSEREMFEEFAPDQLA